jgi:hypothetical protein
MLTWVLINIPPRGVTCTPGIRETNSFNSKSLILQSFSAKVRFSLIATNSH